MPFANSDGVFFSTFERELNAKIAQLTRDDAFIDYKALRQYLNERFSQNRLRANQKVWDRLKQLDGIYRTVDGCICACVSSMPLLTLYSLEQCILQQPALRDSGFSEFRELGFGHLVHNSIVQRFFHLPAVLPTPSVNESDDTDDHEGTESAGYENGCESVQISASGIPKVTNEDIIAFSVKFYYGDASDLSGSNRLRKTKTTGQNVHDSWSDCLAEFARTHGLGESQHAICILNRCTNFYASLQCSVRNLRYQMSKDISIQLKKCNIAFQGEQAALSNAEKNFTRMKVLLNTIQNPMHALFMANNDTKRITRASMFKNVTQDELLPLLVCACLQIPEENVGSFCTAQDVDAGLPDVLDKLRILKESDDDILSILHDMEDYFYEILNVTPQVPITFLEYCCQQPQLRLRLQRLFHTGSSPAVVSDNTPETTSTADLASDAAHRVYSENRDVIAPDQLLDQVKSVIHDVMRDGLAGSQGVLSVLAQSEEKLLNELGRRSFASLGLGTFLHFCVQGIDSLRPVLPLIGQHDVTSNSSAPHDHAIADVKRFLAFFYAHYPEATDAEAVQALRVHFGIPPPAVVPVTWARLLPGTSATPGLEETCGSTSAPAHFGRAPDGPPPLASVAVPTTRANADTTHATKDTVVLARGLLQTVPYLTDAGEYVNWTTVFEPTVGSLGRFLQQEKVPNMVELRAHVYIRVPAVATHQALGDALERRDARAAAGVFTAMVVRAESTDACATSLWQSCCSAWYNRASSETTTNPALFLLRVVAFVPHQLRNFAFEVFVKPQLKTHAVDVQGQLAELDGRQLSIFLEIAQDHQMTAWESAIVTHVTSLTTSRAESLDALTVMTPAHGSRHDPDAVPTTASPIALLKSSAPSTEANVPSTPLTQGAHDIPSSASFAPETGHAGRTPDAGDNGADAEMTQCHALCVAIAGTFGISERELMAGVDESDAVEVTRAPEVETLLRLSENSVHRLSAELYASSVHFLLELIQNSDDNTYRLESGDVPTLTINLAPGTLTFYNNEIGFSDDDVKRLSNIGESSKAGKVGFIGKKGIGFKSVFKVTSCPQIHSGQWHFEYNAARKLGLVIPKPLPGCALQHGTKIVLPLKTDGEDILQQLQSQLMHEIHPSLLLFLQRLATINIVHVSGSSVCVRKLSITRSPQRVPANEDTARLEDGYLQAVIKVLSEEQTTFVTRTVAPLSQADESATSAQQPEAGATALPATDATAGLGVEVWPEGHDVGAMVRGNTVMSRSEWLVLPRQITPPVSRGQDLRVTELAVALPLPPLQAAPHSTPFWDTLQSRNVFSYLPLRDYGFRFIVQSDFDIPSSREAVDESSAWNQYMREQLPALVAVALENLCNVAMGAYADHMATEADTSVDSRTRGNDVENGDSVMENGDSVMENGDSDAENGDSEFDDLDDDAQAVKDSGSDDGSDVMFPPGGSDSATRSVSGPGAFVSPLPAYATTVFNTMFALIPMHGQLVDFFRPTAKKILSELQVHNVVPVVQRDPQTNRLVSVVVSPRQAVYVRDIRTVAAPLLWQMAIYLEHLDLYMLDPGVAVVDDALATELGMTLLHHPGVLTDVLANAARDWTTNPPDVLPLEWLCWVYEMLWRNATLSEHLDRLRTLAVVPLASGATVAVDASAAAAQTNVYDLTSLTKNSMMQSCMDSIKNVQTLQSLHPALAKLSKARRGAPLKFLHRLGVQNCSGRDFILDVVVPALSAVGPQASGSSLGGSSSEATSAMNALHNDDYVALLRLCVAYAHKPGTDLKPEDLAQKLRVANVLVVTSSGDVVSLATPGIHMFDAKPDAGTFRPTDFPWVTVSGEYMASASTNTTITPARKGADVEMWENFFKLLGVTKFVGITTQSVELSSSDADLAKLQQLTGYNAHADGFEDSAVFVLTDHTSSELAALLHALKSANYPAKYEKLFACMKAEWPNMEAYTSSTVERVFTSLHLHERHVVHTSASSFARLLTSTAWVHVRPFGLLKPGQLYADNDNVRAVFAPVDIVPVCPALPIPPSMMKVFGVRSTVGVTDALRVLKSFANNRTVKISTVHQIYTFLSSKGYRCAEGEKIIFVPDTNLTMRQQDLSRDNQEHRGKFITLEQCVYNEQTKVFDRRKNAILSTFARSLAGEIHDLHDYYARAHSVFEAFGIRDNCRWSVHLRILQNVHKYNTSSAEFTLAFQAVVRIVGGLKYEDSWVVDATEEEEIPVAGGTDDDDVHSEGRVVTKTFYRPQTNVGKTEFFTYVGQQFAHIRMFWTAAGCWQASATFGLEHVDSDRDTVYFYVKETTDASIVAHKHDRNKVAIVMYKNAEVQNGIENMSQALEAMGIVSLHTAEQRSVFEPAPNSSQDEAHDARCWKACILQAMVEESIAIPADAPTQPRHQTRLTFLRFALHPLGVQIELTGKTSKKARLSKTFVVHGDTLYHTVELPELVRTVEFWTSVFHVEAAIAERLMETCEVLLRESAEDPANDDDGVVVPPDYVTDATDANNAARTGEARCVPIRPGVLDFVENSCKDSHDEGSAAVRVERPIQHIVVPAQTTTIAPVAAPTAPAAERVVDVATVEPLFVVQTSGSPTNPLHALLNEYQTDLDPEAHAPTNSSTVIAVDVDLPEAIPVDVSFIPQVALPMEANLQAIARAGEDFAHQVLVREFGATAEVLWLNQTEESRKPYDIVIKPHTGNNADWTYVEVKSTQSASQGTFPISLKEILFSVRVDHQYCLMRVFGLGESSRTRIARVRGHVGRWAPTIFASLRRDDGVVELPDSDNAVVVAGVTSVASATGSVTATPTPVSLAASIPGPAAPTVAPTVTPTVSAQDVLTATASSSVGTSAYLTLPRSTANDQALQQLVSSLSTFADSDPSNTTMRAQCVVAAVCVAYCAGAFSKKQLVTLPLLGGELKKVLGAELYSALLAAVKAPKLKQVVHSAALDCVGMTCVTSPEVGVQFQNLAATDFSWTCHITSMNAIVHSLLRSWSATKSHELFLSPIDCLRIAVHVACGAHHALSVNATDAEVSLSRFRVHLDTCIGSYACRGLTSLPLRRETPSTIATKGKGMKHVVGLLQPELVLFGLEISASSGEYVIGIAGDPE